MYYVFLLIIIVLVHSKFDRRYFNAVLHIWIRKKKNIIFYFVIISK